MGRGPRDTGAAGRWPLPLVADGLAVGCEVAHDAALGCDGLRISKAAPTLDAGEVIGIYAASAGMRPGSHLDGRRPPVGLVRGEYTLLLCRRFLYAAPGRRGGGRVNEHWWANCEFVETDVDTGDGDALFTVLALVCTKRVCPLDFIYANYGPEYARVRRARGYILDHSSAWADPAASGRHLRRQTHQRVVSTD